MEKLISEFHKQKNGLHGVRGRCKACQREYRIKYQDENIEKLRERRAAAYAADPEKARQRVAAWRSSNPEKAKDSARRSNEKNSHGRRLWATQNEDKVRRASSEHYQRNKELVNARSAARRRDNPAAAVIATMKWARNNLDRRAAAERKRRARVRGSSEHHTADDVKMILKKQRGLCAACRKSIKARYHVDHIVALANGGSNGRNNLQLLCPTCNHVKGAKCPIEFMQKKGFLL